MYPSNSFNQYSSTKAKEAAFFLALGGQNPEELNTLFSKVKNLDLTPYGDKNREIHDFQCWIFKSLVKNTNFNQLENLLNETEKLFQNQEDFKSEVLIALAKKSSFDSSGVFESAKKLKDEYLQCKVFSVLAVDPNCKELDDIFKIAGEFKYEENTEDILLALASNVKFKHLNKIFEAAKSIEDDELRADLLIRLAGNQSFDNQKRREALSESLISYGLISRENKRRLHEAKVFIEQKMEEVDMLFYINEDLISRANLALTFNLAAKNGIESKKQGEEIKNCDVWKKLINDLCSALESKKFYHFSRAAMLMQEKEAKDQFSKMKL